MLLWGISEGFCLYPSQSAAAADNHAPCCGWSGLPGGMLAHQAVLYRELPGMLALQTVLPYLVPCQFVLRRCQQTRWSTHFPLETLRLESSTPAGTSCCRCSPPPDLWKTNPGSWVAVRWLPSLSILDRRGALDELGLGAKLNAVDSRVGWTWSKLDLSL